MKSEIEAARQSALKLLEQTRRETRSLLFQLDPDRVIHRDERAWRVRDIVGNLGVWNGEAVRSLSAYAAGGEYFCIPLNNNYDAYNGPAADLRSTWTVEQVWAEYEASHTQLKELVQTIPAEKWDGQMLYPWNERGSIADFIQRMMKHEKMDHGKVVVQAIAAAS
jgi:hypothetical protein